LLVAADDATGILKEHHQVAGSVVGILGSSGRGAEQDDCGGRAENKWFDGFHSRFLGNNERYVL